jgi:hypothetical protein
MRPKRFFLRTGLLAGALLAVLAPLAVGSPHGGSHGPPKGQPTPSEVHEVIIDGHCQVVDEKGVPLHDSLYWQRTGHDPC